MAKAKPTFRALRTEKVIVGDFSRELIAGEVYDDLPETVVTTLSGEYGGLEEVTDA